MIQLSPNVSFDAPSRYVAAKVDIYFDDTPMHLYSTDYIVDMSILEECSEDTDNPLGTPAANTLDITLYNTDDIFTPTNKNSPLYGSIKLGVKLCVYFCCLEDADINLTDDSIVWITMGTFYVTDWKVTSSRLVSIAGCDILYKLLNETFPSVFVKRYVSYKNFIVNFLSSLNYSVSFISHNNNREFLAVLSYTPYQNDDKISSVLSRFTQATWSLCYANRTEQIVFNALSKEEEYVNLTENDQVLDVDTQQSIIKSYEGVNLTYYRYQTTGTKKLLDVSDLAIPVGSASFGPYEFSDNVLNIAGITSSADGAYYNFISTWDADCKSILLHTTLGNFVVLYNGYYDNNGVRVQSEEYTCSISRYTYKTNNPYTLYTTKGAIDVTIVWYDSTGNFLYKSLLTTSDDGSVVVSPSEEALYQMQTEAGSYVYADGSTTIETQSYMVRLSDKLECIPSKEYTIEINNKSMSGESIVCFWWDASGTYMQYTEIVLNSDGNATFDIPSDVHFFSAHFHKSIVPANTTVNIIGPTITSVTPSQFTFYASSIDLPLGSNISLLLKGEVVPSSGNTTITVFGEAIESTKIYKYDKVQNALSIDNCYIQSESQANTIKGLWEKYIHNDVPVVVVVIRGNPLLELGDAVHISCPSKKVDFYGIIMKASYSFNGSLSCTLTLLNANILSERS